MVKLVIIIIFHLKKALRMNLQGPILEKGKVFWIPAAFQLQIFQAAFVQELIFLWFNYVCERR